MSGKFFLILCPPAPYSTSKLVLQLDALMAVAHDIPALHRMEHPGDSTTGLGADDFLPIFIYVLVNSTVENFAAQSAVIEALCDPKKMMGEAGVRACVALFVASTALTDR